MKSSPGTQTARHIDMAAHDDLKDDPDGGMCGHSQSWTAMHKYAGRVAGIANVPLITARRPPKYG